MSNLLDRLLHREQATAGPITMAGARLGPVIVVNQALRGEVFASHIECGRAALVVGLVPALEAGIAEQAAAGPTRVRWLSKRGGLSGGLALVWDATPAPAQRQKGGRA